MAVLGSKLPCIYLLILLIMLVPNSSNASAELRPMESTRQERVGPLWHIIRRTEFLSLRASATMHRRELPVLNYHGIMVFCPNPIFMVIAVLLSWIIFIHDGICILTSSPGSYLFMIVFVIK